MKTKYTGLLLLDLSYEYVDIKNIWPKLMPGLETPFYLMILLLDVNVGSSLTHLTLIYEGSEAKFYTYDGKTFFSWIPYLLCGIDINRFSRASI